MPYKIGYRIQTAGTRNRWLNVFKQIMYEDKADFNSFEIIQMQPLWQCAKHCLLSARDDETHLLIMQDDILPSKDFFKAVSHITELLPDNMISYFSNNEHINTAIKQNKHFVKLPVWFMAQCYSIPVKLAQHMVQWIDEYVKDTVQLDDDRMATYLWFNKIKVYATAPSLIEHIGWNDTTLRYYKDDLKTKVHRLATKYIGFEQSALHIDWRQALKDPLEINEGRNSQFISNLKKKL